MQKQTPISPNGSLSDTLRIASSRALALIPGTLAFILYFVTLSPTINFTDSVELITVAWTGGVAHPPGYPLYSLVSSVLIHIPIGDPAWRMNLLSAIFAALAVSLFYILVSDTLREMPAFRQALAPRQSSSRSSAASSGKSHLSGKSARATSTPSQPAPAASEDAGIIAWTAIAGGMAASGLLAVSLTFWNWATQAKFYTLHFAFVAAILWLTLRARHALLIGIPVGFGAPGKSGKSGKSSTPIKSRWSPKAWPPVRRLLHLLAFTIGLSLTNHFLTFLLLPGVALLLLTPFRNARQMLRHVGLYAPTIRNRKLC